MDPAKGYRLRVSGVADLSKVLDGFRGDATRLLARRYGTLVAREAAWALDRWKLGLSGSHDDFVAAASASVRKRQVGEGPLPFPDLNCAVSLHFVNDAVLAGFVHGDDGYRKAWEGLREVVPWGWSESAARPKGVSEGAWEARGRIWQAALSGPPFGRGLRFTLVEASLPDLGWGAVRRHLPTWEERVARAAALLAGKGVDAAAARRQAEETLTREVDRETLVPGPSRPTARPPRKPAPQPAAVARGAVQPGSGPSLELAGDQPAAARRTSPATLEDATTAAERIRREARTARKSRAAAPRQEPSEPERAASIDHADVVVGSDGRVFVAAPYVGLDPENRVFLQVGEAYVAVSQGGMQYGHVTGVPRTAIDLLRTCKTVVLVEVARREDGGRLLRARHVAIVSDIGLSDSLSISLGGFRRPANARGEKEIREWESRQ